MGMIFTTLVVTSDSFTYGVRLLPRHSAAQCSTSPAKVLRVATDVQCNRIPRSQSLSAPSATAYKHNQHHELHEYAIAKHQHLLKTHITAAP